MGTTQKIDGLAAALAGGALLPGPDATLGPMFAEWLGAHVPAGARR